MLPGGRNMKKKRNIVLTIALVIMMAVGLLPIRGIAQGKIEVNRDSSVTLHYIDSTGSISNAMFDIYKVADIDEYGKLTLTDAFKSYPIKVEGQDQKGWNDMALTLKGYVMRDKVTSDDRGTTDQEGKLRFPTTGKSMKPGLYLVVGYRITKDDFYTYTAAPFMVYVPEKKDDQTWNYDLNTFVKYEKEQNPNETDNKYITYKAMKIWDDKGNEEKRPAEVLISLLCDGEVYDSQKLSKGNNWRYSWDNLENAHDWTVVEKEQKGYTTKVTKEGITFSVKNSYSENPPGGGSGGGSGKLPQTGMLWWPVPVLLGCGLICLIVGLIRRKKYS